MSKPSIPQGTRDFSPEVVRKRQYILHTLKGIFENCGFQPIETPSMENLSTLMGKYGEEGDRLIFKILNNGLNEKKDQDKTLLNQEWAKMLERPHSSPVVTERALRYDLTIPFARYVVMHQNDLAMPFRRYQMQPVWRADRPQKGRYREFWQCDCDIVGTNSLINEAELLYIYREAFHRLGVPGVTIRINSRKILLGIALYCDAENKLVDITTAIDKLDKIGNDGVVGELRERGLDETQVEHIVRLINIHENSLDDLEREFASRNITIGIEGISEIRTTLEYHKQLRNEDWTNTQIAVDLTLARGLNYYTGIIVEVNCYDERVKMGSIGGGGRYDDLTGLFGLKNLSGVGISFGIDRIYDVMEQLELFPSHLSTGTKVLILNTGADKEPIALDVLRQFRSAGIAAEIFPESSKLDKQMKYTNKRDIPFAVIIGDEEITQGKVSLKDFNSGHQVMCTTGDAIQTILNR